MKLLNKIFLFTARLSLLLMVIYVTIVLLPFLNFNLELLIVFAFISKPNLIKNKILRFFACLLVSTLSFIVKIILNETYYAYCDEILESYSHIYWVSKFMMTKDVVQLFTFAIMIFAPFIVFTTDSKSLKSPSDKLAVFIDKYLLFNFMK